MMFQFLLLRSSRQRRTTFLFCSADTAYFSLLRGGPAGVSIANMRPSDLITAPPNVGAEHVEALASLLGDNVGDVRSPRYPTRTALSPSRTPIYAAYLAAAAMSCKAAAS